MIDRAQVKRWLDAKNTTLWGRSFDIKGDPTDEPSEWFAKELEDFYGFAYAELRSRVKNSSGDEFR